MLPKFSAEFARYNNLCHYILLVCIQQVQVDKEQTPGMVGQLRTAGSALKQIIKIQSLATEKSKANERTASGLRECENPLLTLPVDLYQ